MMFTSARIFSHLKRVRVVHCAMYAMILVAVQGCAVAVPEPPPPAYPGYYYYGAAPGYYAYPPYPPGYYRGPGYYEPGVALGVRVR